MPGENTHCRPQVARLFNRLPHTAWLPNTNNGLGYESGRPDAFVAHRGRLLCVECKADFGSFFLGEPDDPNVKVGWTGAQRNWYAKVARPTETPYYLALWVYSEREPVRKYQHKAALYLAPPEAWLELEIASLSCPAPARTVALNSDLERIHARKHITAEAYFSRYALRWIETVGWTIPEEHPIQEFLQ